MENFGFPEMQAIQRELREKYLDRWGALEPAKGKDTLLWMIGEACEAGDILKKEGGDAVMRRPEIRRHFVEELCDVMMYFNDLCLCYDISPEELVSAYREKHSRNLKRW